jgi:hypothetical protein
VKGRLKAIQLVTERYAELQGLRMVLLGTAFAGCFGAHAFLGARGGTPGLVLAMGVAFAISLPGMWLLDRYYESRFGRVVRPRQSQGLPWRVMVVAVGSSVLNNWLKLGPTTFVLAIMGPLALWVAIRDWPFRAHHFLAAVAAPSAFWLVFTSPPADRPMAEALAMVLTFAVCVPVGLLDHRLLTTVMPKRNAVGEDATRSSAPDTERSTDRA